MNMSLTVVSRSSMGFPSSCKHVWTFLHHRKQNGEAETLADTRLPIVYSNIHLRQAGLTFGVHGANPVRRKLEQTPPRPFHGGTPLVLPRTHTYSCRIQSIEINVPQSPGATLNPLLIPRGEVASWPHVHSEY
jgi:hypothetical protein